MTRVKRDWVAVVAGALIIAIVVALVALSIWARVAAPCEWVNWLPAKDVPARCLFR